MSYLEFKYPLNLIYSVIPAVCVVLFVLGCNKKEKIMRMLKINHGIKYKIIRIVMIAAGLSLIVVALAGPQTFKGYTEINREGLDIYVLIDTSKSMLAEDIKPSRISRAKKITESILNNLRGDRIGFIPFSSSAYIQMPLTDDYRLARMFLEVIDTDMIGGGGTNIGTAIRLADNSFDDSSSADRVIIVLSDGEEHDTNSLDVLKSIKDEHLKLYTIGTGSKKGGLIPVYDSAGQKKVSYKKDGNGEFVMSKLHPDILSALASAGGGSYYQSSLAGDETEKLINDISSLKRDTLNKQKIKTFKQCYQYFLAAGILLFLTAWILPERRKTG